jgi:hypothetical protein
VGIKRFGRLAGSTTAMGAQTDVTPANAPTPYETVEPATKMFAYGEGVTAQAINRAIGAVAQNVEDMLVLLDTPTTKAEILEPLTGTGPWYGFTSLLDVAPSAGVNLGDNAGPEPVVWVQVGMHQSQLGQFIQLAHEPDDSDASRSVILRPTDVRTDPANPSSYFPTVTYPLSPEHSSPDFVPHLEAVQSDLAPYNGIAANANVAVADWDTDGCRLAGPTTFSSMHMRAGCYVFINTLDQRGLYMIAAISNNLNDPANDKAVLVNGLHRVVLDVGSTLVVGEQVTWSRDGAASAVGERTNSAYVLYLDADAGGDTVYLSTFSGSDDVTDIGASAKASTNITGPIINHGSLGYQEDEVGTNPSGLIQAGTVLYAPSGKSGVVEASIPAGSPVRFEPGPVSGQTAVMFSPPGFLLNPYLVLPAGQGGAYRGYCRTLTSTREKMRSGPLTATRGSWFDDGAMQQFTPLYQQALEDHTRWSRQGFQPVSPLGVDPAWDALSSSAQVLGNNLWEMRVTSSGADLDTVASAGMTLAITHFGTGGVTSARIAHVDGLSLWLSGVSNQEWAAGLDRSVDPIIVFSTFVVGGLTFTVQSIPSIPYMSGNDQTLEPALTTGTCTVAAAPPADAGFELVGGLGSLWMTELHDGDQVLVGARYGIVESIADNTHLRLANPVETGAAAIAKVGHPFVPSSGLNAAYHAHYDSDPLTRGNGGGGRTIQLAGPLVGAVPVVRPVVLQAPDTAPAPAVTDFTALEIVNPAGAVVGALATDGTALQLRDGNTTLDVDLSSAVDTRIDPLIPQNILGALNSSGLLSYYGLSNAILTGCITTIHGAGSNIVLDDGPAGINAVLGDGQLKTVANDPSMAGPGSGGGAAGSWYLVWNGSALAFSADVPTATEAAIAKVTWDGAGQITALVDMRLLLIGTAERLDIQVGGPNAHFATLGEAVALVRALQLPGSGAPTRSYKIRVRGSTTETATILVPSSLTIEGLPGAFPLASPPAVIRWGGDQALFNLNGGVDQSFRNLSIEYEDAVVGVDPILSRMPFDNQAVSSAGRVTIDNVSLRIATANRLHGYVGDTGGGGYSNIRITNCVWFGATDFGILATVNDFRMSDCHIIRSGTAQQAAGGSGGLVLTGTGDGVVNVRSVHLEDWGNRGVVLSACEGGRVDSCDIHGGDVQGTTTDYVGIEIGATCERCWVVNNRVFDSGNTAATARAVECSGDRVFITNNDLKVAAGAAAKTGYYLGAASSYCIVDANQTNGQGTWVGGGPHSIGAMNRDDA